jgi:hypothetical protein
LETGVELRATVRLEGIGKLKSVCNFMGKTTRDILYVALNPYNVVRSVEYQSTFRKNKKTPFSG